MLNAIKNWIRSRKRIGVTLESLEEWFDKKTKHFYDSYDSRISEIRDKIDEEIQKTKQNIKSLENAQLHNDKITTKEVQFMEGNRSFYMQKMSLFIDSLSIPEEINEEFIEKTQKDINELGKATHKAYQILQHFFADESYAIAQDIKSIDDNIKLLKEAVFDKMINKITSIKKDILDIKNMIAKEISIRAEMKKLENEVVDLEEEKKGIRFELAKAEQSPDFIEYNQADVELHKINEQINDSKEDILHLFSILEHSLKKQSKIDLEYEALINKYVENPIGTLIEDKNLDILHILKKLEDSVRNNLIELKDRKEEKTLETIRDLDKVRIFSFLKEYNDLKAEYIQVEEKIRSSKVNEKIDEIKNRIEEKDNQIWNINKELNKMNDEFSKININQMKNHLKEKINGLLDIDLEID